MRRFGRWFLSSALPPLVAFAIVVAVWQLLVVAYDIEKFLLPGPADVWKVCSRDAAQLWQAFLVTGTGACTGFLLSLVAGVLIGCLFSQSRLIRTSLYPYAIFLQTVPIVAIAPLIVLWVGEGFLHSMDAYPWTATKIDSAAEIAASSTNYIYLQMTCDVATGALAVTNLKGRTTWPYASRPAEAMMLIGTVETDASKNFLRSTLKQRWQGCDIYVPTSIRQTAYPEAAPVAQYYTSWEIGPGTDTDTDT